MRKRFPDSAQAFYRAAWVNIQALNYDRAEKLAFEGIQRCPESIKIHSLYASIPSYRKDWKTASGRWTDVVQKFPGYEAGWENKIDASLWLQQYKQAEDVCNSAIGALGKTKIILMKLAECYEKQQKWMDAQKTWLEVAHSFPDSAYAYSRVTYICLQLKDPEGALIAAENGLANSDDASTDHFYKALAEFAKNPNHAPRIIKFIHSDLGGLRSERADLSLWLLREISPWLKESTLKSLKKLFPSKNDYIAIRAYQALLNNKKELALRLYGWSCKNLPSEPLALLILLDMRAFPNYSCPYIRHFLPC